MVKDNIMSKQSKVYICQSCGAQSPYWQGKCSQCGAWNSLVETIVSKKSKAASSNIAMEAPEVLSSIKKSDFKHKPLGISEFDRVLGGGIVPGSVILIGGEPGIGKSTLLLQIANKFSSVSPSVNQEGTNNNNFVLYVSGEESANQIKMRADRLASTGKINLLTETNTEAICGFIEQEKPALVIIDSIQTMYSDELESVPGGIAQVQLCGQKLLHAAKRNNVPVVLIGHVTKEGSIAGPRVLEHLVDVVLYLEGDRYHSYRMLRGLKNRFGATDEVGLFEMTEKGLSEIKNPSQALLSEKSQNETGSCIAVTLEGTRPLLIEIQALSSRTVFGYPKRATSGIDLNRLQVITAVLTKHLKLKLNYEDIYVNIVGGFKISEPAIDLPVALAIVSGFKNKPLDPETAIFGEISLSGEVRSVNQAEKRVKEAAALGFKNVILPVFNQKALSSAPKGCRMIGVRTLKEVLEITNLS